MCPLPRMRPLARMRSLPRMLPLPRMRPLTRMRPFPRMRAFPQRPLCHPFFPQHDGRNIGATKGLMGGAQGRAPSRAMLRNKTANQAPPLGVQRGEGFIQQPKPFPTDQRPGQPHPPLLALG